MNNTKKPVFNADAAEEYFSDLLVYYRNTANDIFRRDNDGRHASEHIYSAEYQKYVGMQIAMREVLEYFSKYELCEWITEIPTDRLRELVPCWHCGGTDIITRKVDGLFGKSAYQRTYKYVQCRTCFSQTGYHGTEPKARLAWNTRAPILSSREMEMLEGME